MCVVGKLKRNLMALATSVSSHHRLIKISLHRIKSTLPSFLKDLNALGEYINKYSSSRQNKTTIAIDTICPSNSHPISET